MASTSGKRKASTASINRHQKRQKTTTKQREEYWETNWDPKLANQGLEKGEFPAKHIVEENRHRGFLIRWKGQDQNGNPWKDTWGPKKYAHQELRDDWELWKHKHPGQTRRETSSEPGDSVGSQSTTPDQSEDHESIYRADTPKKQRLILHFNQNPQVKVEESPQPSADGQRLRPILKPRKLKNKDKNSSDNPAAGPNFQDPHSLHTINPNTTQREIPDSQAPEQGTDSAYQTSSAPNSSDTLETSDLSTGHGGDTCKLSGDSSQTSSDHLRSVTETESQHLSNQQNSQGQSLSAISGQTNSNTQSSAGFGDPYSQSQASFKPPTSGAPQTLTQGDSQVFESSAIPSCPQLKPTSIVSSSVDGDQEANYGFHSSLVPASSVAYQDGHSNLEPKSVGTIDPEAVEKTKEASTVAHQSNEALTQSQPASSYNSCNQVSRESEVSSGRTGSDLPAGGIAENTQVTIPRDRIGSKDFEQQQPLPHSSPDFADTPNFIPFEEGISQDPSTPWVTSSSSVPSQASQIRSRVAELLKEAEVVDHNRKMEQDNAESSNQNGPPQEERLASQIFAEYWAQNMVTRRFGSARRPKFDPVSRQLVYPDETSSGPSGSTESHLPPDETQRDDTHNTQVLSTISSLPQDETQQNLAQETEPPNAGLATQSSSQRNSAPSLDITTNLSGRGVAESQQRATIEVPLPLSIDAQRIYKRWFDSRGKAIEAFFASDGRSPASQRDMKEFLDDLKNIAFHQDLVIDETETQGPAPFKAEAKWAIDTSSKFQFLADLFDATRDVDKHVAIFVRPGRPMSITATFLKGRKIAYRRPDLGENMRKYSRLHVTVLGTDEESSQIIADRADLIIGLDDSFDARNPLVRQMKGDALQTGKNCPVLSLVAVNTPEHIGRVLSPAPNELERTQKLVSLSKAYSVVAGIPKPPIDVASLASKVSDHLLGTTGADLKIPGLDIYPINLSFGTKSASSHPTPPQKGKGKRTASESSRGSDAASKKPRLSAEVAQPDPSASLSRITNTAASKISPKHRSSAASNQKDEAQKLLQQWIRVAENREETVATLQPQVEQLSRENMSLKNQVAELERYKAISKQKDEDIGERDETITRLKAQLLAEQKRFADSTVPEHQELEAARERARQVEALQKKNASQAQELEYVREQYQTASSRATEYSEESQALDEEVKRLRVQASGEARKLKETAQKTTEKSLQSEVERLKAMLKSREQLLQQTGEDNGRLKKENQALKDRSGVTTRAAARSSSVPMPGDGPPPARRGTPTPAQSSLLAPGGAAMRQAMAPTSAEARAAISGVSRPGSRTASRAASRTGSPAPGKGPPRGSFSTKVVKKGAKD
ncbi:MAG: hypothetical protein M1831_002422 [Alyxoria varia]|nr:MAG: hypothetical protein M1831_002422 [Alyxoria varia]